MRFRSFLIALLIPAIAWATINGSSRQRTIEVAPDDYRYALYPDGVITPATGILAAATASRTSCAAPCSVHFDASGTTRSGYSAPAVLLGLDYHWDFGDTGAGNWARGAKYRGGFTASKNAEDGFEAQHTFETAGTYTVKLLVTDGTTSDTLDSNFTITVTSANAEWATTETTCVSANTTPVAGSGGCPAGANVAQQSSLATILATTCNLDDAAGRCLLKGGDTFTSTSTTEISNSGPSYLGSYGTGNATISHSGTTGPIEITDTADLRIVDLTMTGTGGVDDGTSAAIWADGGDGTAITDFLALRVTISGFTWGIYNRGNYPAYEPGVSMHDRFAVVDSSITHSPATGGFNLFLMGDHVAVMGTRMGDNDTSGGVSTGGQTVMRTKYLRDSIIAHNDAGLIDGSDSNTYGCSETSSHTANILWKFVSDFGVEGANALTSRSGETILADNYISACRQNVWQVAISPTDTTAAKAKSHFDYWVVEGNHFVNYLNAKTSGSASDLVISNASHIAIRNNVFDLTVPSANGTSWRAIWLQTNPSQVGQTGYVAGDDIRVFNNTGYQSDAETGTRVLFAQASTDVTSIQASNNLLFSTLASALVVSGSSSPASTSAYCCGTTTLCATTIGTCNLDASSSPFSATPSFPSILSDFNYSGGSAPLNTGVAKPGDVSRDAVGKCRPDTTYWDIGHYERSGATCATP